MFECINGLYYPCDNEVVKHLPNGVYTLSYNRRSYKVEAKHSGDYFKLPQKIYSVDREFIDKVKRTFLRKNGNLGVLLNGYRGSGKTITAKILCNEMDLPVFIINEKVEAEEIQLFINALHQDAIVFIDEYEKIFGRDGELLSLMDGALNLKNNILFLLTSNEMDINENLFNRPSRILYIKQFGGLSENQIKEILDDCLVDGERRDDVDELVDGFQEVTIDNLMVLLDEINNNVGTVGEIIKNLNITFKEKKAGFKINRK